MVVNVMIQRPNKFHGNLCWFFFDYILCFKISFNYKIFIIPFPNDYIQCKYTYNYLSKFMTRRD